MTRSFSEDFGPFEGRVWLNCAHQGPLPPVAAEAASEALAWKTAPHRLADESFHSVPQRMKRALGQLIGVSPDEIILGNSTSYGLHLLANGIPWQRGDEVLLAEGDFPANILPWLALRERGASGADANRLEAVYEVPFLAHVTPEPMNCVADVRAEGCDVWASTQNPGAAKGKALSLAGVPREAIRVHVPLVGGGFGRRLRVDYVEQAVEISQAVGAPVKVTWTREDDFRHDFYHPHSVHRVSGRLDPPGMPSIRTVTAEGWGVPTGAWRAVTNVPEAFVRECFVDELAAEIGRDPYELRLELPGYGSLKSVLELAATKADWYAPLPAGWGRGIACHATWGVTPVAQVVEAAVDEEGNIRVHRVVCAVDCGLVINPDMVEAQMEGGIVFGLTAALKGEITLQEGRVQQGNFYDHPLLTIDEMPTIEVHIVPSEFRPTGAGEMGNPPAAPALLNAIFAATGQRIRKLQVRPEDLREA